MDLAAGFALAADTFGDGVVAAFALGVALGSGVGLAATVGDGVSPKELDDLAFCSSAMSFIALSSLDCNPSASVSCTQCANQFFIDQSQLVNIYSVSTCADIKLHIYIVYIDCPCSMD